MVYKDWEWYPAIHVGGTGENNTYVLRQAREARRNRGRLYRVGRRLKWFRSRKVAQEFADKLNMEAQPDENAKD